MQESDVVALEIGKPGRPRKRPQGMAMETVNRPKVTRKIAEQMRRQRERGVPLRQIARETGFSHEWVRQMTQPAAER